jgi:hypothetical protein
MCIPFRHLVSAECPATVMRENFTVRLADEMQPKRGDRFDKALSIGGANATNVIRALVDAYCDFVEKEQRLPSFPLVVSEKRKKRAG